jgi:hypothetical protein
VGGGGLQVIHLSIFVVAVLYAAFVGALVSLSLWISRLWRRMEDMDYEEFVQTKGRAWCGGAGLGWGELHVCRGWANP